MRPLSILITIILSSLCQAQRSDPTQFNGGSTLAMAGRNSVAIAIDARFGLGMQTISTGESSDNSRAAGEGNPRILHLPNSNVLLAWAGLHGDGTSFAEEMNVLLARKVRRAGCMGFQHGSSSSSSVVGMVARSKMSPRAITSLMSHLLYGRRNAPYYVEPVVVGLETVRVPIFIENDSLPLEGNGLQSLIQASNAPQLISSQNEHTLSKQIMTYKTMQKPYLCGTDMLGAQSTSHSFVCSGVASRSLHGTAEALWVPNLEGEELVEVCGRAFVSALERDCLSGYGAVVYLIQGSEDGTEDDVQIIEYVLACRND
ncbi:hypothetical protein ACHAXR_012713 [Thalassiosira sp. AJA248-18]